MALYVVPQFASKDAALRRKCRKMTISVTMERHGRTCYCGTEAVYDYIIKLRPLLSQIVTICAEGDLQNYTCNTPVTYI